MNNKIYNLIQISILFGLFFVPIESIDARDYSISYYRGRMTSNAFSELWYLPWEFKDSYIQVISLTRQLDGRIRQLTFETEGQIAKHHEIQDHFEVNVLLTVRLYILKRFIPTSIAFGQGVSYAFEMPELEQSGRGDDSSLLLNYFMVEMAWDADLFLNMWSAFFRVHHRSGVGGTYCDFICGSNIPSFGFRFFF